MTWFVEINRFGSMPGLDSVNSNVSKEETICLMHYYV